MNFIIYITLIQQYFPYFFNFYLLPQISNGFTLINLNLTYFFSSRRHGIFLVVPIPPWAVYPLSEAYLFQTNTNIAYFYVLRMHFNHILHTLTSANILYLDVHPIPLQLT